jgi:hypothetical protein
LRSKIPQRARDWRGQRIWRRKNRQATPQAGPKPRKARFIDFALLAQNQKMRPHLSFFEFMGACSKI